MKQIIRYLYEYENGNRTRNVGFIKLEKRVDKCAIQIHGKNLDFGQEKKLGVFVFYTQGEECIGIPQGVIEDVAPVINYILKFDPQDAGGKEVFEELAGLILQNNSGKTYAAMWKEEAADIQHMVTEHREVQGWREDTEEENEEEISEEMAEDALEDRQELKDMRGNAETALELTTEETKERESLIEHVEKLVEQQEFTEEVEAYIPPKTRTYEKIQRQDLARLPRTQWHLANNSFLLHGFYNYHHLVYIEEGENRWIGVPGIYHEKERAAARAFGFPQFHRVMDADLELSVEEKNTFDDFGYWCRQI